MIPELPHSYLKLQVLFYIPKRFADNLAGRYSFIVKKFLPTLTCIAVPRTWNLEPGDCIKSVPGKLGDGDLWAGDLLGNVLEVGTHEA